MRRFSPLLHLAFFIPVLSSCQLGEVDSSMTTLVLPYEARTASCATYTVENKAGDVTDFGEAKGNIILVGFRQDVSADAKLRVLQQYPFFERTDGEIAMDSGEITKVILLPEATCFEAEKTIKALQKHPEVTFAAPVFNTPPAQAGTYEWVGLSNEILVMLDGADALDKFNQLLASTNTSLVFSLSDEIHIVSADKNSAGNALELSTQFNQQDFIASAEPNLIYYLTPSGVEDTGMLMIKSSSKKIKTK